MSAARRPRVRPGFVVAWLIAVASIAVAQRALDANLQVGSKGRNRPLPPQRTMSAPIYTVNYNTGEMAYNRANAFRDPTYRIHQRYTLDRFTYFDPTKPGRKRGPDNRAGSMLARQSYSAGKHPAYTDLNAGFRQAPVATRKPHDPSELVPAGSTRRARKSAYSMTHATAPSTQLVRSAQPASSLKQPTYSPVSSNALLSGSPIARQRPSSR